PHAQVWLRLDDLADAVDVALDEVAAEAIGQSHRTFEVHGIARLQVAEARALPGLVADVGLPPAVAPLDDGQAAAVDGDRRPHLDVVQDGRTGEPQAVGGPGVDPTELLDDPGEHPVHVMATLGRPPDR